MLENNDCSDEQIPIFYPYASQPVLDYLFSIDLRSFIGVEPRSLQNIMLRNLDMDMIASRRHKAGIGVMFRKNLTAHESLLLNYIEDGFFYRNGLLNIDQIKRIFLECKCGITTEGLPLIINLIDQEIKIKNLQLKK